MIPLSEISLILRGWSEEERRIRVLGDFGSANFSAFCGVVRADESTVDFMVGGNPLNVFRLNLADWVFDFADAPQDEKSLGVLGSIESSIVGVRVAESSVTVCLFLMEES
jgi:hypothetical protein